MGISSLSKKLMIQAGVVGLRASAIHLVFECAGTEHSVLQFVGLIFC